MAKAKYQFEDFLTNVKDEHKDFVIQFHEMMLKEKYRAKISITKSTGMQLAYHQPKIKTVAGIVLILFIRNEEMMLRLYGKNHEKYHDLLNDLPSNLVSQIDEAGNCVKFTNPDKCWKGCIGYEFNIKGNRYQKCLVNCFEFEVDASSMPYLLKLVECESKARFGSEI